MGWFNHLDIYIYYIHDIYIYIFTAFESRQKRKKTPRMFTGQRSSRTGNLRSFGGGVRGCVEKMGIGFHVPGS